MKTTVPTRTLANGVEMPVLGYGVFQTPPEETVRCVREALEVGYRMIDTAQSYANEEGVGAGLRDSGLAREDVFLTTKIAPVNLTQERAAASIDESLRLLGTDYIDLMLLHQPIADFPGAYRALEEAYGGRKTTCHRGVQLLPGSPGGHRPAHRGPADGQPGGDPPLPPERRGA